MKDKVIYRVRKKDQWVVEKCIPVEGCDPEVISSHWDEASAERFARQVAALDPGYSKVDVVRHDPLKVTQARPPFVRHAPGMTAEENAAADVVRERDIAEIRRLQGKT